MVENILFSQNNGMFENVIFEEFIQIKNQYKIAIGKFFIYIYYHKLYKY